MNRKHLSRRDFLKFALGTAAAGVVTGCAPQQAAAPVTTAETAAELSGKIVCWGWDPCDVSFKSIIPSFQAKYPKAEIEVVNVPWDDIHPKLTASIEAGTGGPDICVVEGYLAPQFQGTGIMELTDRIAPYRSQIAPAKFAEVESDGKIWGIPWELPPAAIMYRSDMFEKAGITEIPKTWDAFVTELGPKLTTGGTFLFAMDPAVSPTFYWYRPLLYQIGSGYFTADGQILLGDEKSKRALQWMVDAIHTHKVAMTGVEYFEGPSWWSALKDNKVASIFAAPWMIGMMKSQVPEQAGLWKVAPLPVWDEGNAQTTVLGGASVVIPEHSQNKELAWKFAEAMLLTVEGNLNVFKSSGIWPSFTPTFDDKSWDEPDPYFGGQAMGRVFADLTPKVPSYFYGKKFVEAERQIVRPEVIKVLNQEESVDEGLAKAVEGLKQLL
ncbi:MAG: hypothetical protein A2Z16_06460 [Chloroflexi bacterium RBG_16_54_18]|nr:MAG: hypothetical protein A2Z16_06460 [Chloroflexi bacterium RBG_16_54_18]